MPIKISKTAKIAKGVEIQYEEPAIVTAEMDIRCSFRMGAYSYFRNGLIRRLASIGRYSSIGPRVMIGETEHPVDWLSTSPFQYSKGWQRRYFQLPSDLPFYLPEVAQELLPKNAPVVIGNDVWIGANVVIRTGVHIGNGAICATGAVINKDVLPYTIVGGIPAKPIRKRFTDAVIQRLDKIEWWKYDAADLAGLPFHDIDAAIDELQRRVDGGLTPRPVVYQTFRTTEPRKT